MKRPENSYTKVEQKTIDLLTVDKDSLAPLIGSARYRDFLYPGDIDLRELYTSRGKGKTVVSVQEVVSTFAKQVKKITKEAGKSFIEFKAGLDDRYNVDTGYLERGHWIISQERRWELSQYADALYEQGLLTDDEHMYITGFLAADDSPTTYELLSEIFRNRMTLRWTADEVIAGKKKLPGGVTLPLTEALRMKTVVKMDLVEFVGDHFQEIGNFWLLAAITEVDGKVIRVEPINVDIETIDPVLGYVDFVRGLKEQIEQFCYSETSFNPLKACKRAWTLARITDDHGMMDKLTPIINSEAGRLSQLSSQLTAAEDKHRVNGTISGEQLTKQIDRAKYVLSTSSAMTDVADLIAELDEARIKAFPNVKGRIKRVVNNLTIDLLTATGLNPFPRAYLPDRPSYVERYYPISDGLLG